jgi:hypothetical protein
VIVSNSFRTFEREISLFIEFALKSNLDDWLFQWRGGVSHVIPWWVCPPIFYATKRSEMQCFFLKLSVPLFWEKVYITIANR